LGQIEENLRSGKWSLGDRLPGERALAEQMGVSRPSVREAIRVLEAMGIVRTAVGSGPDAGAAIIDRPAVGLGAAVRLHIASGTLPVRDVVATRAVLEVWATGQAAQRCEDGTDFSGLYAMLDDLEASHPTPSEFVAHDAAFHMGLVKLADNQLTEAVLGGLRAAVGDYIVLGAERLPSWSAASRRLCGEHRAILDAVATGDAVTASQLAHNHIWGFYEEAGLASEVAE